MNNYEYMQIKAQLFGNGVHAQKHKHKHTIYSLCIRGSDEQILRASSPHVGIFLYNLLHRVGHSLSLCFPDP